MTVGLAGWMAKGVILKALYLIVLRDTLDGRNYPLYVMPTQKLGDVLAEVTRHPYTELVDTHDITEATRMLERDGVI